jgi:hypothetical protein
MWPNRNALSNTLAASKCSLSIAAVFIMLLALAPAGWAQTDDSKPEELGKQRSALYLRATHAPLADLASDVNQIAVVSETCRVKYGSTACGLPDKALESDKLEERYAYYVKRPVEAHSKPHAVKIDRRNWAGSGAPAQP